jgi:hypothetical protein
MNENLRLPFFDPDYCLKVARWSSVVCVVWLLIELALLAVVDPEKGGCSNWIIFPGGPSEINVWLLMFLLFTAAPGFWMCFIVVRWSRFSQKIYSSILERPDLNLHQNHLWLVVCTGWAMFCSLPLWFMLSNCTNLFRRFGF